MNTQRFKELLEKRYLGDLSSAEQAEFEGLLDILPQDTISRIIDATIPVDMQMPFGKRALFRKIQQQLGGKPTVQSMVPVWLKYAAAVLLLAGAGWWLYQSQMGTVQDQAVQSLASDIILPDDQATVRLEDGHVFVMDELTDSIETAAVKVQRISEGVYYFNVLETQHDNEEFHTFSTPKGVSTKVILADGTQVWLNSASQIQVSSLYAAGKRHIKLTGEAYFEVAKQSGQPFDVQTKETMIRVLGTKFNVRSLPANEKVQTTLAEGSVQVSNPSNTLRLTPGSQAITAIQRPAIQSQRVDVSQVLAWKDGYFVFSEQPLDVIMDELLRWYDIDEVVWEKHTADRLTLSLTRSRNLSELLKNIEMIADVKFEINERRIIVK